MAARDGNRRSEDPGLAAWLTLVQAESLLVDLLEADLQAGARLPLGWFEVLVQLTSASEGRMKMQELARSVLLSKSGVTRLVDRMETAGLISRTPCPTDRRAIYAVVTPEGRAALRAALPIHLDSLGERFTRHLSKAELDGLRATLQKILDAHGFAPNCPSVEQLASADESREAPVG